MIVNDQIERVKVKRKTPGGDTYYVLLKGKDKFKGVCYRKIHNKDAHCSNVAGAETYHLGTGACYLHGGGSKTGDELIANTNNGRLARVSKSRLKSSIDNYLNSDRTKLLDLTSELASTKAIFEDFMDTYKGTDDEDYGLFLIRFTNFISTVSNLVEKMSRIEARNTLTAAQVIYLRAVVADILMKYIADPLTRERAARELASRVGGDIEAEIVRVEL